MKYKLLRLKLKSGSKDVFVLALTDCENSNKRHASCSAMQVAAQKLALTAFLQDDCKPISQHELVIHNVSDCEVVLAKCAWLSCAPL